MQIEHLARWISRLGHPFILPLLALAIVTTQVLPAAQAFATIGLIIVTTTIPLVLYTRHQIRRQRWTDYDVSVRQHRYRLYGLTLAVLLVCALIFWLIGAPAFMLRGIVATIVLACGAALANVFLKISLHTSVAIFCALAIVPINSAIGGLAIVFALLIGWSRVVLRRHTPLEVISGALLGAIVGVALIASTVS